MGGSTVDSKGYIFCGFDASGIITQDCVEYVVDTWTAKTNTPAPGRYDIGATTI